MALACVLWQGIDGVNYGSSTSNDVYESVNHSICELNIIVAEQLFLRTENFQTICYKTLENQNLQLMK